MTITLCSRRDFTLEVFERVSRRAERVSFADESVARMEQCRAAFLRLIEQPDVVIYGVTSGYGQQAHLRFTRDERKSHARRPPLAAAASFGQPLPDRVVRGIIFARLANYVEGHAAISPPLAIAVGEMLGESRLPVVPSQGNGSAGEILALSHLFHGLASRFELQEKDALALINGSPCATALVSDAVLSAEKRFDLAMQVFALSLEAIRAPYEQIDTSLDDLWGDRHEATALNRLRGLISGGSAERRPYQAPVSWRVVPRILGQALRSLEQAREAAEVALKAVTDNPVFVPPDDAYPDGRVLSNGGYHNAWSPAAMDALATSYANLAVLCDRQVSKLLDGRVSLLPHQLIERDGYLGCLGFTAAGYAEHARQACSPTLLPGSEGGGFGQNDVASPVFFAWQKSEICGVAVDAALACLAVIASQAFHVTARQAPPKLEGLLERIRENVRPVRGPKVLGPDVESLATDFAREAKGET